MDTAAIWIDIRDIAARQTSDVSDGVGEFIQRRYMKFTNAEMLRSKDFRIRISPVFSHANHAAPTAPVAGRQYRT
ncbi:hypothetical protein AWC29_12820 [Mycobacterium triplex]|uniref:Uncharacterized protein n=1 Tax=Mycobacterium triplex TaxID=47839 RepID=A0ABX3W9C1_9MYCO|nr:hypothetical protein AWC29_12820 [Mycobacterium triplex]